MLAFFSKAENHFRKFERFLLYISGIALMVMMLVLTLDVFMRNLFNKPIAGVLELVTFLIIGVSGLGFSYVQGIKENIIVEVLTSSLDSFYKNILDICGYIVGLFVVGIIAWQSGLDAFSSFVYKDYTDGLIRFPLWPAKSVITFSMATLVIRLVLDIVLCTLNLRSGAKSNAECLNAGEKIS